MVLILFYDSVVMSGWFSEVGLIQLFDVRASFRYIKLHIVSDCECNVRCYSKLICCSACEEVKVNQGSLQAWSGPEGSRKLRFPDFVTTAQDGGKVVSLTHQPPLPPGNTSGTHFC